MVKSAGWSLLWVRSYSELGIPSTSPCSYSLNFRKLAEQREMVNELSDLA